MPKSSHSEFGGANSQVKNNELLNTAFRVLNYSQSSCVSNLRFFLSSLPQGRSHMDSTLLLSEPDDIGKWFASYVYESPELDSADGIRDLDGFCSEEKNNGKCVGIQSVGQREVGFLAAMDESKQHIFNSPASDEQENAFMNNIAAPGGLTSEVSGLKECSNVHVSLKKCVQTDTLTEIHEWISIEGKDVENGDDNLIVSRDAFHCTGANVDHCSRTHDRKGISKDNLSIELSEKGDQSLTVSRDAFHCIGSNGAHCSKTSDRKCMGKENRNIELSESGFVSVRKYRSQGNNGCCITVQSELFRNQVKDCFDQEKDGWRSSRVLSERSNFSLPSEVESGGKWYCPQKRKPELGPPLKQLRLERWIRRS